MSVTLTDEERNLLGFHLACRLEDLEKQERAIRKKGVDTSGVQSTIRTLEELIYTRIIPESWSGPKPSYWK